MLPAQNKPTPGTFSRQSQRQIQSLCYGHWNEKNVLLNTKCIRDEEKKKHTKHFRTVSFTRSGHFLF